MLPTALSALLIALLELLSGKSFDDDEFHQRPPRLRFDLRHEHGVSHTGNVVFSDVRPVGGYEVTEAQHELGTRYISSFRPPSFEEHSEARMRSIRHAQSTKLPWYEDTVLGPAVESRETLLELAKMTNNAYVTPNDTAWYKLGNRWVSHYPFGWEPDADGFRGYVFATPDNSTVVLSIKGTSANVFGGGGPTAKKDKFNDNLLFSCCCARVGWTWTTVCGCYRGGWKCDQLCLEQALIDESLFYPIGTNLYNNLTYMYPHSNIWIIGHSLGGALASLLGVTFGVPVVAFESPGERLAAQRLHLPSPPSTQHVTHVYHTADPIAMGTCNGVLSSCSLAGFAMETKCHLGESIVYDTVSNLSWSVNIQNHGIVTVIENVLGKPWTACDGVSREVPIPKPEVDCVECYSWEFGDFPPAVAGEVSQCGGAKVCTPRSD
ncbi:alpha/beta-hydrolase [Pisolithus microcarpus]|nr:alpha/beta-hydrolase [Pisolithus microcarpus]